MSYAEWQFSRAESTLALFAPEFSASEILGPAKDCSEARDCSAAQVLDLGCGAGGKGIYFATLGAQVTGVDLVEDYRSKAGNVESISVLLSAKPEAVAAAAARQNEEVLALRAQVNLLKTQLIQDHIQALPDGPCACLFDEHLDKTLNHRAFNQLLQRFSGLCGCFAGNEADGYQFVLGGRGLDAREAGKEFCTALGGKGGGSAEMFQGRVNAPRAEIEDWFAVYRHESAVS